MMQPVPLLTPESLTRIPLYKDVFFPFESLAKQGAGGYRQQCKPRITGEQCFQKLTIVFDDPGKQSDDQPTEGGQGLDRKEQKMDDIEFVLGFNQYYADVVSWRKGCRYRFALQLPGQSTNKGSAPPPCPLVQVRRRLLVIVQQEHVYVHDLVRHNGRLSRNILACPASSLSLLSLDYNEHYICSAWPLGYKKWPTLSLSLYRIDMADNFNVVPSCSKQLVFQEQAASIAEFCLEEGRGFINAYARVEGPGEPRVFLGRLHPTDQGITNVEFRVWQADSYLVANYCLNYQKRYSRIRSSWLLAEMPGEYPQPCRESRKEDMDCPSMLVSTGNFNLLYKPWSPQLVLIAIPPPESEQNPVATEAETRIIEHRANIVQVVHYRDELVYLLDQQGCVWEYDFEAYHDDPLGWDCKPILDLAPCIPSDHQVHQIRLMAGRRGRLGATVDGHAFIGYPSPFRVGGQKVGQLNPVSAFLSIQSSQFQDRSMLVEQKESHFILPQVSDYLSLTANHLRVGNIVVGEVLPSLRSCLQSSCRQVKQLEVTHILQSINQWLGRLREGMLGTALDCEDNHFYWALADLWLIPDVKIILTALIGQLAQSIKVIELVLTPHKLKDWLVGRCQESMYPILCTTHYSKCKVKGKCPCAFKRVLRQILIREHIRGPEPNLSGNNFHLRYSSKWQLIELLQQDSQQLEEQLEQLMGRKQGKIRSGLLRRQSKMIRQVDSKWNSYFQVP